MEVAQAVECEEDDAQRVGEAARAQPQQPMPAESVNERHHRDDHEPALPQVDQRRGHREAVHGKALEDDPGDGQRPLDTEDRPAERPVQRNQAEGRVGSGDEQVDG